MRKTYSIIAAVLAAATFAACDGNTESGSSVEEGSSSKSSYESNLPADSGDTSTEPAEVDPNAGVVDGVRLVPKEGIKMAEGTNLTQLFINGVPIDILDCTVQDIVQTCGVVHNSGYSDTKDLSDFDFYFYGEGFSAGFDGGTSVQIEALKDGKLLEKYDWEGQYDEEYEAGSEYKVKGVSFGRYKGSDYLPNFVTFCGNVRLGMSKKKIEDILGPGEEVVTPNHDLSSCISLYKTDTATMAIYYDGGDRAYSIVVVVNE